MAPSTATPSRERLRGALGATLLALVLWTAHGSRTDAQNLPAQGAAGFGADAATLAGLEGVWVRDAQLSEEPIGRLVAVFGDLSDVPEVLRNFAQSLLEQRRGLSIRADGGRVTIQNAAGELLSLPFDGRAHLDAGGNRTSGYLAEASLEVVTKGGDWPWLWRETYRRSGDRLIQVTESQNLAAIDLSFYTVYDLTGGKSPPPDVPGIVHIPPETQAAVRIVPPRRKHREFLTGSVEVQALVIDPLIGTVDFLLDGKRVKQSRRPPFKALIRLEDPPRAQTLEVRGYGTTGNHFGSDRIVLNGLDLPFAIRITDMRPLETEGASDVRVEARISVPQRAALASVDFYGGERRIASFHRPDWRERHEESRTIRVEAVVEGVAPDEFVRVAAHLADGREREDAKVPRTAQYSSEIDVQLIQLQILVVDRDGNPLSDLQPDDFEVRENGERRPVERLHVSNDVPLVLGVALDSSESMRLVWQQLHTVVRRFMASALDTDDRAFLVDFDDAVRLLQPTTGDRSLLAVRLGRLLAEGGTAINDGLLFSLLQFRHEPGRRALIVVTDGDDRHSRTKTAQVTDFAERVGIPIYFIAVGWAEPPRGLVRKLGRRTGGRVFRVHPSLPPSEMAKALRQVFERIDEDLRRQLVLTYYSNSPTGQGIEPDVRSLRKDALLRSVLPLDRVD
ncbi:MAG: VWA domain-containing protein [Acidobacteriota bacterium]|nr:VWA domain-containing protein [Acidobacteriota bacterium]MDE3264155.1 VWA domain-containing protein [Acidobacteriota bacterium]